MNEPSPNDRTLDGRFAPGNAISQGNLGNKRMKELRRALLECATEEKVKAVEESLHELAVGGDVAAAKVWLDHVVGKPVQALEVSGPDGQALNLPSIVSTIEGFNRITWLTIVLWFLFWASSKANERAQKERAEILGIVRRLEARAERPAQT